LFTYSLEECRNEEITIIYTQVQSEAISWRFISDDDTITGIINRIFSIINNAIIIHVLKLNIPRSPYARCSRVEKALIRRCTNLMFTCEKPVRDVTPNLA